MKPDKPKPMGAATKIRIEDNTKKEVEALADQADMSASDIYRMFHTIGIDIAKREGVPGLVKRVIAIRAGESVLSDVPTSEKREVAFVAEKPAAYSPRKKSAA